MDWIRDYYKKDYAANSRETIRRFTLHQFADTLLVEQNPDKPDRPVNSPKWCYQIHHRALEVIRTFGQPKHNAILNARNVTADGATLRTVADNVSLLPHVELACTVTVPFAGTYEVPAVVRSIRHEPDGAVVVEVSWIDPPRAFLAAVAEYLMIAGTGLTPAQLRAGGLSLRTVERTVTFGAARQPPSRDGCAVPTPKGDHGVCTILWSRAALLNEASSAEL